MARPRLNIDPIEVQKLAALGCDTNEIADWFGCSRDTIEKRFSADLAKGRQNLKMRVRRAQLKIMEAGNAVMAIWLGKQMLKQSDKMELSGNSDSPPTLRLKYSLDDE